MFNNGKVYIINALNIIPEFKIRSKADAKIFKEKCMSGGEYRITGKVDGEDFQLIMEKDKKGNVNVMIRSGDLHDIFNPNIEIASDTNKSYKLSTVEAIWKYRKLINHNLLSLEE